MEFVPKRGYLLLRLDPVTRSARIASLSSEPAHVSRLPEDRQPAVLEKFQKGFGPAALGEADRLHTPVGVSAIKSKQRPIGLFWSLSKLARRRVWRWMGRRTRAGRWATFRIGMPGLRDFNTPDVPSTET